MDTNKNKPKKAVVKVKIKKMNSDYEDEASDASDSDYLGEDDGEVKQPKTRQKRQSKKIVSESESDKEVSENYRLE